MKKILELFKKNIGVVLLFILSSIYATYPIIFKINSSFYGDASDPLSSIWTFWWEKYAYMHGISPYFISIIAYPFGMISYPVSPVWAFFSNGLTIITGEVVAYNLQIILNFFLAGIAMFCLIYYFVKNRLVAILIGIIFTLSPYHFTRSWDHLSLSSLHWMIFYIYSLFVFVNRKTYKSSFICGLCFALMGQFSSFYYVYFMVIFTLLFVIFKGGFAVFKKQKVSLKEFLVFAKLSISGLLAIVLIMLPQIWRYLKVLRCSTAEAKATGLIRSFGQLFADSALPLNYFLPTEYHPILGGLARFFINTPLYGENSGGEQSLYLGIIPLILAFFGYKQWKKDKVIGKTDLNTDFLMRFWIFVLFAFMICSFSPYWGSRSGIFVPFPSFFLFKLFPMFRNYARMGIVVMVAVCVLAGFGLTKFIERFQSNKKKIIVVILIGCGVLFEFLNVPPYRITDVNKIPDVYQWLKEQPANTVVADYPIEADRRPILFYQRVHKKSLINGAIPETDAYEVMQKIIDLESETTPGILSFLGAKYLLVHKDKYRNYEGGRVLGEVPDLNNNPGLKFLKDYSETSVYEVIALPIDPKVVIIKKEEFLPLVKQRAAWQSLKNMSFKFRQGDDFKYSIKYMGFINLLNFDINLEEGQEMDGNRTMLIKASAYPTYFIARFLKGKAQLQSLFDINNFYNYKYEEVILTENKVKEKKAVFDRENEIMITKDRQVKIDPYTQDPVSAIFFLSSQEMLLGKKINIPINPGKTNYQLELVIESIDQISIDGQVYKCWKLNGELLKINDVNKRITDIHLWINSMNKQELIKLEAMTKVGLVTLEKQVKLDGRRDQ